MKDIDWEYVLTLIIGVICVAISLRLIFFISFWKLLLSVLIGSIGLHNLISIWRQV